MQEEGSAGVDDDTARGVGELTGTLPAGDWESALVLDGVPRLRVRFAFDADGGRIEALEAEHPEDQEDLP